MAEWSKAPEWADKYGEFELNGDSVWYNDEQYMCHACTPMPIFRFKSGNLTDLGQIKLIEKRPMPQMPTVQFRNGDSVVYGDTVLVMQYVGQDPFDPTRSVLSVNGASFKTFPTINLMPAPSERDAWCDLASRLVLSGEDREHLGNLIGAIYDAIVDGRLAVPVPQVKK